MQDLQSFLSDQQSSGLIDSSGEFTIAADKALSKLAHSQLPEPSYWILKLMQFASAWDIDRVEAQIGKNICTLQMLLPDPVSLYELQKGLDSVDALENRALDHLVTALRALGGIDGRRFVLRLVDREWSEYLFWNGKELSLKREQVDSAQLSLTLEVTANHPQMWNKLVDALSVKTRAKEASLLAEKAFTVPFRLRVDGRQPGFTHFERARWFTQPVIWDFVGDKEGMPTPHMLRAAFDQTVESQAKQLRARELGDPNRRISAFWNISYNYQLKHKILRLSPEPEPRACASFLHWLKDGVIVKTEQISSARRTLSLELFVDAGDCPADLGGLNLRKSKQFLAKRRWVQELLKDIAHKTKLETKDATRLSGRTLGGWDTVIATTSYLPLSGSVTYEKPGMISTTLNSLPGFRKKMLLAIKRQKVDFSGFRV